MKSCGAGHQAAESWLATSSRGSMLRGSQPGALLRSVWRSIAQTSRTRRAIRFGFRLWKGAANLKAVVARDESLNEWYGRTIAVERATAGPAIRRQDVHPLHHADIFMIEGMAMGDKAAHSHRIEIRPKGNRSRRRIIDVHGLMSWNIRTRWLWCLAFGGVQTQGSGNIQGVVPFWPRQGDAVYFSDQHMILMHVERMVSKRAIGHRPLFVVTGDHVGE